MKTSTNLIITLIFLLSGVLAHGQKLKDIRPIAKKQSVKVLTGKKKTYYKLNTKETVDYEVIGLEKVIVYSRKRVKKNKLTTYAIVYKFDNLQENSYRAGKTKIDRSSAYIDKNIKRKVASFYKKQITIPTNANTLSLSLEKTKGVDVKVIGFKAGKRIALNPKNAPNGKTRIRTGEVFKYYKLNSSIKTEIKLEKHGKLIVYTRMRLGEDDKANYSFSYKIDRAKYNRVNVTGIKPASKTMYRSFNNTKTPSSFRKTIINIDDAAQVIEFTSEDPVDARFVLIESPKEISWKAVKNTNKEKVILTTKKTNKNRVYTRISNTNAFDFTINAKEDSKLKLFVRGEFTYDMHSNDYEIVLSEEGKIVNTYKLSCDRSKKMRYKDNDELIPGTLDKVFIKIPKGKHHYSINVNNKGKTALIRVLEQQ